jgi:hypothetical protein
VQRKESMARGRTILLRKKKEPEQAGLFDIFHFMKGTLFFNTSSSIPGFIPQVSDLF